MYQQINEDPQSLHPALASSSISDEIFSHTQLYLLNYDFRNKIEKPYLAVKLPKQAGNKLSFTYEIRTDLTWENGEPVTINDLMFTFKANCCELVNNHHVKFLLENIDSLECINSKQFKIKFKKEHFLNFVLSYSLPVLQKSKMDSTSILDEFSLPELQNTLKIKSQTEKYTKLLQWANEFNSEKYGTVIRNLNGGGEFYVESWERNVQLTLKRKKKKINDKNEKNLAEKIILVVNKDPLSQLLLIKNQKIDLSSSLDTKTLVELIKDKKFRKNYNFAFVETLGYTYLGFNCKAGSDKKIFNDLETRKAISHLLPYALLNKISYFNKNSRAKGPVSEFKKEFYQGLLVPEQDRKKALEFLKKGGWKAGKKNILEKKIKDKTIPFQFELAYYNSSPVWQEIALLIKNELKKSKIEVSLVCLSPSNLQANLQEHKFDAYLGAKTESMLPEDFYLFWHSEQWKNNGTNYTGFGNPFSDSLIDCIQKCTDENERIKTSGLIQKIITEELPVVFLFKSMRRMVLHKRWGGQYFFHEKPFINSNELYLIHHDN